MMTFGGFHQVDGCQLWFLFWKPRGFFPMAIGRIKLSVFGIALALGATRDYARPMVGMPYRPSPEILEEPDVPRRRLRLLAVGVVAQLVINDPSVRPDSGLVVASALCATKERNEAVEAAVLLKSMDYKNTLRFHEVLMTRNGRLCIAMD